MVKWNLNMEPFQEMAFNGSSIIIGFKEIHFPLENQSIWLANRFLNIRLLGQGIKNLLELLVYGQSQRWRQEMEGQRSP